MPAGLVYLVGDIVPRLAPATSNGLAAGSTPDDAVLGGLCEVMERDAFLLTWLHRRPAVEVDLAASGPTAASIHRQYRSRGVTVRAFVLDSDLPAATLLALAFDDDPALPAQVVGLGCHPDPAVALVKALFELCQARPAEARRLRDRSPEDRLERAEDVETIDDHSAFAAQPDRRSEFEFLWASGATTAIGPAAARVDAGALVESCVGRLVADGHRVAYVDLTLPDIRRVGLRVVRALITDLQPIHFGYGQERLGGPRLGAQASLNPCPHPLA